MDKCYKLHGFPPRRPSIQQQQTRGHANNVSTTSHAATFDQSGALLRDELTPIQCQQLLAFLTSQLHIGSASTPDLQHNEPSISCFNGTFFSSKHPCILRSNWILDTRATHHICCTMSAFQSCKPCSISVKLPNNVDVPATHIGVVHLSPNIILKDVLLVPEFTLISFL